MLTPLELAQAVLLPIVLTAVLVGLARWRRLWWAVPSAVVVGFLTGWVAFRGVPGLPPLDGTDWLFWVALGVGVVSMPAAFGRDGRTPARTALMCLAAGVAFGTVAWPLVPGVVPYRAVVAAVIVVAAGTGLLGWVAGVAARRVGAAPLAAACALAAGGAGVVILSSNLRVVGVYGLSVSASLAGAAVALVGAGQTSVVAARVVVLTAAALMAGLLAGGCYYPEPGVPWVQAAALFGAPLLVLAGAFVPTKQTWARGVMAVVAVGIAAAAVSVPVALRAMRAAEADPYAAYR